MHSPARLAFACFAFAPTLARLAFSRTFARLAFARTLARLAVAVAACTGAGPGCTDADLSPPDDAGEGESEAGEGEGEAGEGEGEAGEGEGEAGEGEGEAGEGEGEGEPFEPFFLAVGSGGRRLGSPDGTAWDDDNEDVENGGDDDDLLRGACAGDRFGVAVGGSAVGRMMITRDGANFQSFIDTRGWLGACAVGHGVIAAAGSDRSIRSIDEGLTWIDPGEHRYGGLNWQVRHMTFLDDATPNGLFVASSDLGISVSTDAGLTWSDPAGPAVGNLAAGNGVVVLVGDHERSSSTDGLNWTTQATGDVRGVTFDGSRFVIVGSLITQFSADGVVWDERASDAFIDTVAFGNGVYVGATFPNARAVSTDALAWTPTASDDGNFITGVAFVAE